MMIRSRKFFMYVLSAFAFLLVLFSVCPAVASADVVQTTVSTFAFSSPISWKDDDSGLSYSLMTPFQLKLDNSVRPGVATQPNNQLSLQFQDYNTLNPALPGGHTIPFPTGGMGSPPSDVDTSLFAVFASGSSSLGVIPSPGVTAGIAGKWTIPDKLVITDPFSVSVNFTSWSYYADSSDFSFTGLSLSGEGVLSVQYNGSWVVIYQFGSWVSSYELVARYPDFGLSYQKNMPTAFWAFMDANATFCPVPYNQSSGGSAGMEPVSVPVHVNFSGNYAPDLGNVTSIKISPPAVGDSTTMIVSFQIFFENMASADPIAVTITVPQCTIIASTFGIGGLTYNYGVQDSYNSGYALGYYEGQEALKPSLEAQYNQGYSDGRDYQASLGENSFFDLISAVVDAPVLYFTQMLDFELLGFNMQSFVGAFLAIGLLLAILRFIL